MKQIVSYFIKKNIIFKSFDEISPKELNSRKRIKIFSGVDIKHNYCAIFIVDSKIKFVTKQVNELMALLDKLILKKGHNYKKKYLLIGDNICSKSVSLLKSESWSVYRDK